MIFALMTKLVIALTKQVVISSVAEPGTTVLTCLIDFVTAQENATQTALARMEGKLDDIHQNPFRLGKRILMEAARISDAQLRRDRIQRALDAFTQASEYSRLADPLIPLKARLSAGACYDLLNERSVALDGYEEVFRSAKEFQKVASQARPSRDGFDLVADAFSSPLDVLEDWLESRQPDYRERQQLIQTLQNSRAELDDFIEKLLLLIIGRKGVSREEYLKPWAPPRKKQPKQPQPGLLPGALTSAKFIAPKKQPAFLPGQNFLWCPKCNSRKRLDTCPACAGFKKQLLLNCARCGGTGRALVCQCDQPANPFLNRFSAQPGKSCLFCGGRGKYTVDNGRTWRQCIVCKGSGRTNL